jgi:outer membrane protein OmpA-like peptidoglycan-associated protein
MGGLDIFASYVEDDGSFSKPFNLRAPFNSSWDDFNLVVSPNGKTGLFISNRNNAVSSDDIYMFDDFPPKLLTISGNAFDEDTQQQLKEYTITVEEGGKQILKQVITDGSPYFVYAEPGKIYKITTTANGLSKETEVTTVGVKNFADITGNVYLGKAKIQETEPEDEDVTGNVNLDELARMLELEMRVIFYEFDKFRLNEESRNELDKYVQYFTEYPGLVVEIGSHTDIRGSSAYNQRLSEFRAKAVVEYFVSKGINANRIVWKGYGKDQLAVPKAKTEAEHQANRRTVFKVLTLGQDAKRNIVVKHISVQEILNSNGTAVDLSGWWVQVYASSSYKQLDLPIVKQAEGITGREVRLVKGDDGVHRYCIRYATRKEAIDAQLSLHKKNINTILLQF